MKKISLALFLLLPLQADIGRHSGFVGIGGGVGDRITQDLDSPEVTLNHDLSLIWGLEGGYQFKVLPFLATRFYMESRMTLFAPNVLAFQTQFSLNTDIAFRLIQVRNDRSFSIFLGLGFGVVQDRLTNGREVTTINLTPDNVAKLQDLAKIESTWRAIGFTNVGAIFQVNESGEVKTTIKSPVDLQNSQNIIINFTAIYIHHF